jgi:dolichol-phosphate mannosyltransferase
VLARVALVRDWIDEVVVVDDGSTDASLAEVAASGVAPTVLRHGNRRGLGESFRTAYRHVLARSHEVFAVMAGNGKDDPRELPRVLGPVFDGRADYVQGSRFHPGGRSERLPIHRWLAIHGFTRAISLAFGQPLTDCSNGYRAYRTRLLTDPRIDWEAAWQGSSYQVEIYLLLKAIALGYRVTEVPVSKIYPADGKPYSKAKARDWWNLLKPVIWCRLGLDRPSDKRISQPR